LYAKLTRRYQSSLADIAEVTAGVRDYGTEVHAVTCNVYHVVHSSTAYKLIVFDRLVVIQIDKLVEWVPTQ